MLCGACFVGRRVELGRSVRKPLHWIPQERQWWLWAVWNSRSGKAPTSLQPIPCMPFWMLLSVGHHVLNWASVPGPSRAVLPAPCHTSPVLMFLQGQRDRGLRAPMNNNRKNARKNSWDFFYFPDYGLCYKHTGLDISFLWREILLFKAGLFIKQALCAPDTPWEQGLLAWPFFPVGVGVGEEAGEDKIPESHSLALRAVYSSQY